MKEKGNIYVELLCQSTIKQLSPKIFCRDYDEWTMREALRKLKVRSKFWKAKVSVWHVRNGTSYCISFLKCGIRREKFKLDVLRDVE